MLGRVRCTHRAVPPDFVCAGSKALPLAWQWKPPHTRAPHIWRCSRLLFSLGVRPQVPPPPTPPPRTASVRRRPSVTAAAPRATYRAILSETSPCRLARSAPAAPRFVGRERPTSRTTGHRQVRRWRGGGGKALWWSPAGGGGCRPASGRGPCAGQAAGGSDPHEPEPPSAGNGCVNHHRSHHQPASRTHTRILEQAQARTHRLAVQGLVVRGQRGLTLEDVGCAHENVQSVRLSRSARLASSPTGGRAAQSRGTKEVEAVAEERRGRGRGLPRHGSVVWRRTFLEHIEYPRKLFACTAQRRIASRPCLEGDAPTLAWLERRQCSMHSAGLLEAGTKQAGAGRWTHRTRGVARASRSWTGRSPRTCEGVAPQRQIQVECPPPPLVLLARTRPQRSRFVASAQELILRGSARAYPHSLHDFGSVETGCRRPPNMCTTLIALTRGMLL